MKSILTLTVNPSVDINTAVDRVIAEKKLRCEASHHEPGGGGINVSRAIGILGGGSLAMYFAGGATGKTLRKLLDQEGIVQHPIDTESWTRENFIVFEKSSTQQYRFGLPGPEVKEAEWRKCLEDLSSVSPKPDFIVASGSLPPGAPEDFYARVARLGSGMGSRVVLDTSGPAFHHALEEGLHLIKPNLRELRELVGDDLDNESEQEEAAVQLVHGGKARVVIVSLGAAGAFMASREGIEHLRAPTVKIQSKVGAGDSMVAGIVFSLAQDRSLRESARYGVAAGAAAVMTPGTELCRREDVERLYDRMISKSR